MGKKIDASVSWFVRFNSEWGLWSDFCPHQITHKHLPSSIVLPVWLICIKDTKNPGKLMKNVLIGKGISENINFRTLGKMHSLLFETHPFPV